MGKISKDDKIKLLEAKVSLLEAEVLLKDELLLLVLTVRLGIYLARGR